MINRASALFTVAQTRRIEAQAMAQAGFEAWPLMQRAGAAAFKMLRARWPLARCVLIVCGNGNNAGDGYVVARLARAAGLTVRVVQVGNPPARVPGVDALHAWRASGGEIDAYFGGDLAAADLVVDALFGIGLDRVPSGLPAEAIAAINRHAAPCFALDLPSGLNADSGHTPGACVEADATISFIASKRGLWTGAAARVCGDRYLDDLAVPASAFDDVGCEASLLHAEALESALRPRHRDAHKGDCGHVLVVGGDHGFGGAVVIAAAAALRAGAGLVTLATRAAHVPAALARHPECMVHAVDDVSRLAAMIGRADVVVLGPGLGLGPWSVALAAVACAAGKPLVLDADALNLLAAARISLPKSCVLTPHPGEAARLLATDTAQIACDRYAAVRALALRFDACVILKGSGSLIASPQGEVFVCPYGNPGMASGGMGDALSGVIAAFIGQGMGTDLAARVGVLAHAMAADLAARDGERGMIASDLISNLRRVVNP